jgi:hypothetical protein
MRSVLGDLSKTLAILVVVLAITACASTRLVDTQVNSFATPNTPAASTYQFDRLPSQAAKPEQQDKLEALAQQALSKVGLHQQDGAPLRIQVSAVQRQEYLQSDSGLHLGLGLGWVFGNGTVHLGHHGRLFPDLDRQTGYWRQVSLLMRDASGAVVFESHASHDGIWSDSDTVLAAMLDAALEGFPTPPAGVRQVNIEIPR